jgi:DNA-binding LacI/PurR family transcriptional regulator
VVILDDGLAVGAVIAAERMGLNLMRDVQIATHANKGSPRLRGHEDKLLLLEVDPDEVVAAMFDMLEPQMQGGKPGRDITIIPARITPPAAAGNAGHDRRWARDPRR